MSNRRQSASNVFTHRVVKKIVVIVGGGGVGVTTTIVVVFAVGWLLEHTVSEQHSGSGGDVVFVSSLSVSLVDHSLLKLLILLRAGDSRAGLVVHYKAALLSKRQQSWQKVLIRPYLFHFLFTRIVITVGC